MGSYSWIAVKGREKDVVFAELGVEPTGGPEASGERLSWGETKTGWLVIWSTGTEYATTGRLALVSKGAEAVGFYGTTVVMAAEARYFRDGQEVWAVAYDCEKDPAIAWTGDPPAELAGILEAAHRAQEGEVGADLIYDVPADVAFTVCGHHDEKEWLDLYGLRRAGSGGLGVGGGERVGFFAWLFGRR